MNKIEKSRKKNIFFAAVFLTALYSAALFYLYRTDKLFTGTMTGSLVCTGVFIVSFLLCLCVPDTAVSLCAAVIAAVVTACFYPDQLFVLCPLTVLCFLMSFRRNGGKIRSTAALLMSYGAFTAAFIRMCRCFYLGGRIDPAEIFYGQRIALGLLAAASFGCTCLAVREFIRKNTGGKKNTAQEPIPRTHFFVLCSADLFISFVYCLNFCGMYFIKLLLLAWGAVFFVFAAGAFPREK